MILNEFFNLPQVFEKDMTEGAMDEAHQELRDIVANEDFDALYELFSADTPAGKFVQDMYDDVVIDTGLHPDDDFERIEQIVFDRLADDFGEQGVTEKRGDLRPKLGSARDQGKSVRQWRQNRGLDEQGVVEGLPEAYGPYGKKSPQDIEKIKKYKEREAKNTVPGQLIKPESNTKKAQYSRDQALSYFARTNEQGVAEAKGDYVPPKEAEYGPEYQAMVRRVGQKAKQQEKARQQQPKAPVRESRLALLKQIIQS